MVSFRRRVCTHHASQSETECGRLLNATAVFFALTTTMAAAAETVEFDRDVRPILANKCYSCHGPDANARQAGLRLDSFMGATADLESGQGKAVVPGKLTSSVLWQRIVSKDENERMPPTDSNRKLTAQEKTRLQQWIENGARYQQHWAYRPIRRPTPPRSDSNWIRNPIDQFIHRRLEQEHQHHARRNGRLP